MHLSPATTDANLPANNLSQLLALHDQAFIHAAYQKLLGRHPDPEGLSYYLGRLRNGIPKMQILTQLRLSTESKAHTIDLPGLDVALQRYQRGQLPLIGWLFRQLYNTDGNTSTERKLRSIENQIFLLRDESNRRFNQMETTLAGLHNLVVQRTHAISESPLLLLNNRLNQMETVLTNLHPIIAQQTQPIISEQANVAPSNPSDSATTARTQTEIVTHDEISLHQNNLTSHSVCQFKPTTPVVFPMPKGYRKIYYYVDHTILCPVNTGMQRVARRLGRALLEAGEQIRFVKWDAHLHQFVLLNHDELGYLSQWGGSTLSPKAMEEYTIPGTDSIPLGSQELEEGHWLVVPEVTHITYQAHPMTLEVLMGAKHLGLKTAFVYYDATPLRRAELNGMTVNHETYMQQLLLVDLVVPISNWSARDLVSFFHVHEKASLTPTPRIAAIPLPGESQLAPRVTEPASDGTRKLILSVGSITPHKNQLALVHAFEHFCKIYPKTDWQLALVGNLHPDVASEITRATQQNSRIQYLEHIPDDQLDALYRSCAFTVFPSVEEGFGLPILESLWYGKPCVCANFGAMVEVAQDGGCFTIDTRKNDELLRAITCLMTKPKLLRKLSQEAVRRPITTWNDYGQRFIAHLDEASDPLKQMGVIYYWVDHTSTYPSNSGIQRVVRGLARALVAIGLKLVPVKWDAASHQFYPPSQDELEHLAHWNGLHQSGWSAWIDPVKATTRDWILIPELTTYLSGTSLADLKRFASSHSLRIAIIFHDAIPWKMRDIYPIEATRAHEQYMKELSKFELILPNSQFTRGDLISFLSTTLLRTSSLENRIQASMLPGEFLESERITEINRGNSPIIKILCVGTVEPRKNHLGLLQAFAQVVKQTKKPVELIIVGSSPFPELATQVQHYIDTNPSIRWEKGANDTRLRELFTECDFTVFPSLEEGFGLPILESLWNARPCVCRNSGAMAEVAEGGGCLMVETADPDALAQAIRKMVENDEMRIELAAEAISRPFKTWHDYAREVATRMATERHTPLTQCLPESMGQAKFYGQLVNLRPRPLLSICITTFNRAEWLSLNLKNLARLLPNPCAEIEIVVCDNTSSDHTPDVVQPYLQRSDFRYYRNPINVGMLGNLRVTAHHARGQYIWILGDDDLVKPGSIEKVLQVIQAHPSIALVYLNYAYTRQDDATAVTDLDKFLNEATPISPPVSDILGSVSQISTESENFFTAIYCLVFRRDHALRAYTQNIEGRPFSTLLTCIPTTYYTLNFMMNETAYWVGEPQLVVNLNVSWMKYAPLWILERIPEAYDLAERMGAEPPSVDRWRNHNLPGVVHFFKEIYESDEESNMDYFSPSRLMGRIKHLDTFASQAHALRAVYEDAHVAGHPGARIPPSKIFANFENI
jgi:glycosyltransferase involved in cell wall biosynthesis